MLVHHPTCKSVIFKGASVEVDHEAFQRACLREELKVRRKPLLLSGFVVPQADASRLGPGREEYTAQSEESRYRCRSYDCPTGHASEI